jgi:myo-inositol catabolism protein IolS
MQYKYLGNKEIKISKVALGTWQFGGHRGWGSFNVKEGEKIIECCLEKGVNLIDTAEAYGESEEILGKLLKGKRQNFFIATKLTTKIEGNRFDYKTIKSHLTGSLKKLQTDYIDLYQIHWPKMKNLWHGKDMEKKDYEDIFDSMTRLKKEGLIRFAGVSNFREHHLKEFTDDARNLIVSNQVPYSILWRCYDVDGTAEFCKKHNVNFLAYSPLAQGLLTGRFRKDEEIKEKVRQVNILFNEPIYSKALKVVEEIKKIASKIGAAPSQVSLKWAMEKEIITSVIVGARKLKHFEENVAAVDITLNNEHMNYIDKLSLEFQNKNLLPGLELWIFNCIQEDLKKLGIEKHWS